MENGMGDSDFRSFARSLQNRKLALGKVDRFAKNVKCWIVDDQLKENNN